MTVTDQPGVERMSLLGSSWFTITLNPVKSGFCEEFVAVLMQFPDMVVNCPHFILSSIKDSRLREFLDTFPNLYKVLLRGYEAALILRAAGFTDVKVLNDGRAPRAARASWAVMIGHSRHDSTSQHNGLHERSAHTMKGRL